MRRILTTVAALVAISGLLAPTATGARRPCGDITSFTAAYAANQVLSVDVTVASPGCGGRIEYYVFVRDEAGDPGSAWNASRWASGWATTVRFASIGPIPDDDPSVCISVRSQTAWSWDPAPDASCLVLIAGGGAAGTSDPAGDVLPRT